MKLIEQAEHELRLLMLIKPSTARALIERITDLETEQKERREDLKTLEATRAELAEAKAHTKTIQLVVGEYLDYGKACIDYDGARQGFNDLDWCKKHSFTGMPPIEDAEVYELGKRIGWGALMDSAARQWRKEDENGAFIIGGCVYAAKEFRDKFLAAMQEVKA